MASKKVLVVFGATGVQGGSVVKSILNDPKAASQFQIRAVTRDSSKPKAKELASKGAELIQVRSGVPSAQDLNPYRSRLQLTSVASTLGGLGRQRFPQGCVQRSICGLCRDELLGERDCGGGSSAREKCRRRREGTWFTRQRASQSLC